MTSTCEHDHTPNATTRAALLEAYLRQAQRAVSELLEHGVYDADRSDECFAAVCSARRFLDDVAELLTAREDD